MRSNSTSTPLVSSPALIMLLAALVLLSACASAPPPPAPAPAPAPVPDLEAAGVLFFSGTGTPDVARDGWQVIRDGVKPLDVDLTEVASDAKPLSGDRVTVKGKTRAADDLLVLSIAADKTTRGLKAEGMLRAHPAPEDPQSEAPRWFIALDDGRTIDATTAATVSDDDIQAAANTRVVVRADYDTNTAFKADNWTGLTLTQVKAAEAPKNHQDLEGVFMRQGDDSWAFVSDSLDATPIDVTAISKQLGVKPPAKKKTAKAGLNGKSVLLKGAEEEAKAKAEEDGPGHKRYGVLAKVNKDGSLVAVSAHALREPGRSEGLRVEGTVKRVRGRWQMVVADGTAIELDVTQYPSNVWRLRGKPLVVTGAPILSGEAPRLLVEEVAVVSAG